MKTDSIFALLLIRMQWAELLVRKQAIIAVKDMLLENKSLKEIFLKYLKSQKLEIKVLDYLLAVYLVIQKNSEYFSFDDVDLNIEAPSILSDLMLEKIFNLQGLISRDRKWKKAHSESFKGDLDVDRCIDLVDNSLVSLNITNLLKFCRAPLPVYEQLSYEVACIEKNLSKHFGKTEPYFYNNYDKTMSDVKAGCRDLIESAFLRLIAFLVDKSNLPTDYATFVTTDFIPADFSILKIAPVKKGDFLSLFDGEELNVDDFVNSDFIPVFSSAPLCFNDKGHSGIEFFLITKEMNLGEEPSIIFSNLKKDCCKMCFKLDFRDFDNSSIENKFELIKKYTHLQRLYLHARGIYVPNIDGLNFTVDNDKLLYMVDNQVIGYWQYWYENYDAFYPEGEKPCGVATYLKKDFIKDFCLNEKLALVVRKSIYTKRSAHDNDLDCERNYYLYELTI